MDKDRQEYKAFLEEQVKWCKIQDRILFEIEVKLQQMKEIAEHTLECELSSKELDELNVQLLELKREVHLLEDQLQSRFH